MFSKQAQPCSKSLTFTSDKKEGSTARPFYQPLTTKEPENERHSFRLKSESAEMAADYIAFKAAGLMDLWLKKWSACLSFNVTQLKATP